MKYTYLEHTADAKFQAFGKDLAEAFHNAALATAGLMWDVRQIALRQTQPVEIMGMDLDQLLVGFLEEILFLLDSRQFLLGAVEEIDIQENESGFRLEAIFRGDVQEGRYEIFGDVKAITYNEMLVKQNDRCLVQVVVDM
jgi:SHS2 domain-containing protein